MVPFEALEVFDFSHFGFFFFSSFIPICYVYKVLIHNLLYHCIKTFSQEFCEYFFFKFFHPFLVITC